MKTRIVFDILCFDRELIIELENEPDERKARVTMDEAYDTWFDHPEELGDMCCEEYICECLKNAGIKFTWINE